MNIQKSEIQTIENIRFFKTMIDDCVCLGMENIQTEYGVIFSDRDNVLSVLKGKASDGWRIIRTGLNTMCLRKKRQRQINLSKFIYCLYHGLGENEAETIKYVKHRETKDRDVVDCRECNLYIGGAVVDVDYENNTIFVKSNAYGYQEVFDYNETLLHLLKDNNHVLFWNSYGRFTIRDKEQSFICMASDLAYLSYNNNITLENYKEEIKKVQADKKRSKKSIEHLVGNFHNHRKYNLSLVPESLNSRKNDKISRITEPYCFTVVYTGNAYKIIVGKLEENDLLRYSLFITERFENVVSLLDIYFELYPDRINKIQAKQGNKGLFQDYVFCSKLVRTPEDHFKSLDTLQEV